VRESFVRSPRKSVSRASRELQVPKSTVRKILRKRLHLYPYKLQLIQKLNCEDASTMPSRMSQKTCLRGFGENGSTGWTSVASHVVRTSNAFKVITKLQTFLFQMPVVSCIFV
jgi:hypothetical protein